jgi:hypothetical protein
MEEKKKDRPIVPSESSIVSGEITKRFSHGRIYHAEMEEGGKAVLWKKYENDTTAIKVESTRSPTITVLNCLSIRSLSVN